MADLEVLQRLRTYEKFWNFYLSRRRDIMVALIRFIIVAIVISVLVKVTKWGHRIAESIPTFFYLSFFRLTLENLECPKSRCEIVAEMGLSKKAEEKAEEAAKKTGQAAEKVGRDGIELGRGSAKLKRLPRS